MFSSNASKYSGGKIVQSPQDVKNDEGQYGHKRKWAKNCATVGRHNCERTWGLETPDDLRGGGWGGRRGTAEQRDWSHGDLLPPTVDRELSEHAGWPRRSSGWDGWTSAVDGVSNWFPRWRMTRDYNCGWRRGARDFAGGTLYSSLA